MNALMWYMHKFTFLSGFLSYIINSKEFTKTDLYNYRGIENNTDIYLAFAYQVYNVSSGRKFYGPGGMFSYCKILLSLLLFILKAVIHLWLEETQQEY